LGARAYEISQAASRLRSALLGLSKNDKMLTSEEPLDNPRVPLSKAQKKRAVEKAKKKKIVVGGGRGVPVVLISAKLVFSFSSLSVGHKTVREGNEEEAVVARWRW
jgi:23S rRNA pseudoU1915 N3-methylase RlmH